MNDFNGPDGKWILPNVFMDEDYNSNGFLDEDEIFNAMIRGRTNVAEIPMAIEWTRSYAAQN